MLSLGITILEKRIATHSH